MTEAPPEDDIDDDDEVEEIVDVKLLGEEPDEDSEPQRFFVSSYGWDIDVEGLVKRLDRGDIYTPGFQRAFVWTGPEKSRFIESLILGLPVPTVFLAQDADTKRLNIVDGQQRLKTLQEFLHGKFALRGKAIQEDLQGRYFSPAVAKSKSSKTLDAADARTLADSVIHSIIIRPNPAHNDDSTGHEYNRAVIQIFRRLNTSGRPLQAQEVRASIFYGPYDEMLRRMNVNADWRQLFGKEHSRLKDVEAILRFLALLHDPKAYKAPMPRYLDNHMEAHRHIDAQEAAQLESEFARATALVVEARGPDAFKKGGTFVLSTFDAVMVGLVNALQGGRALNKDLVAQKWSELEADKSFQHSVEEFVNDTNRVPVRLARAIDIFGR